MIDVFVSRPTWIPKTFNRGLQGFLSRLADFDMRPRTLGVSDYPTKAPLDEVMRILDQCQGAVILGYPQIEVKEGRIKGKAIPENFTLPTEWNHIEAGLAYARGLPLLVIHHLDIRRGIFDRGAINTFIYEKNLLDPAWSLAPDVSGALRTWHDQVVKGGHLADDQAQQPFTNEPSCPNCSTAGKKLYLSRIPPDFVKLQGATHECMKCHSTFTLP